MTIESLDQALLDAHARSDFEQLIVLYTRVGEEQLSQNDIDAACFYFTHAYVFALEAGAEEANDLNKRLVEFGREVENTE